MGHGLFWPTSDQYPNHAVSSLHGCPPQVEREKLPDFNLDNLYIFYFFKFSGLSFQRLMGFDSGAKVLQQKFNEVPLKTADFVKTAALVTASFDRRMSEDTFLFEPTLHLSGFLPSPCACEENLCL